MLEMLVDRLRWPAAMVRERAASQLGCVDIQISRPPRRDF